MRLACSCMFFFFFSSRRRHTRSLRDWSSDVCSSDLLGDRSGTFPLLVAAAKQKILGNAQGLSQLPNRLRSDRALESVLNAQIGTESGCERVWSTVVAV